MSRDSPSVTVASSVADAPLAGTRVRRCGVMRVLTFAPKAFRAAREAAGLSQSDLAGQLGVTRSLIAHWEGGRRAPSWEELEQLAGLFGVPVERLHSPTAPAAEDDLRTLRRRCSLTQVEVARSVGLSRSGYSGNERGTYPVSVRTAEGLAQLFGVAVEDVVAASLVSQDRWQSASSEVDQVD